MGKDGLELEFEKYISDYELLIHKVCRLYASGDADRQDLFQEIVIQLWKSFQNFEGRSKFSTWMYRIALSVAITGMRRQKGFIDSYEPAKLPQQIDHDTNTVKEEPLNLLYKAIGQLNPVEKGIVMLYMDDKTYAEMEDILGINQGNLRVKMNRIKEKIRELTKHN